MVFLVHGDIGVVSGFLSIVLLSVHAEHVVVSRREALERARKLRLDLVEVQFNFVEMSLVVYNFICW